MKNKNVWIIAILLILIVAIIVALKFDEVKFIFSNGDTKVEMHGKLQPDQDKDDHPPTSLNPASAVSTSSTMQSSHGSQSPNQINQSGNNIYVQERTKQKVDQGNINENLHFNSHTYLHGIFCRFLR